MVAVAVIPVTAAGVAAAYAAKDLSPVSLGDLMLRCRRELGISQQELARRSGITPGTLHHFEAVALMPEPYRGLTHTGKLAFKTARALTALVNDPRFTEIAALFTSRRLSSVYIEAVVRMAKLHPKAEAPALVTLAFTRAKMQPRGWVGPVVVVRRTRVDPKALQAHILALAGEIEAWGMQEHCEVERLPVIAAARVLDDRLHRAVLATATANGHTEAALGGLLGQRRSALLTEEPDRRPRKGQVAMNVNGGPLCMTR